MATSQVLVTAAGPAGPPPGAPAGSGPTPQYSLVVTHDDDVVRAAQRLRHDVFAIEQGARLAPGRAAEEGRDEDAFDAVCDHLVVREDRTGEVVGTYRMLTPEGAARAGGLYSDTEFDLRALDALRPRTVEVGRSCVHPDHRSGPVLSLVWAGILRYLLLTGHRWVAGCASVPLDAAGACPGPVWSLIRDRHLAPASRRVLPHRPAPIGPTPTDPMPTGSTPTGPAPAGPTPTGPAGATAPAARRGRAGLPPLLRGYLRLGAEIGGPPALDPDFGVADLFVLLDQEAIDPRWRRHLIGEGG